MSKLFRLYKKLLKKYGYQGWWPIIGINKDGYHPADYSYPKNKKQIFEIAVGAILTQNTTWKNAAKAIENLRSANLLDPIKLLSSPKNKIIKLIKSAGYYNQKAKKLIYFSKFFKKIKNKIPKRQELLKIWGIGPETADSILLYAYKQPYFIVDKYTYRFLQKYKLIKKSQKFDYEKIRAFIESEIKKDYKIYQEFHALIVQEQKLNKKLNKLKRV
jgi:endonuclease-3 related protein